MAGRLLWALIAPLPMTKEKDRMEQEKGHRDPPTSSRTPHCGSPHPWEWRTGPANTSTCTRRACSVAASPSPTCCLGTADPSRSPCWSPVTASSEKRPVRCSNWCRPTWATGRHAWTGATAPSLLSPSAGIYRVCGTSCMSSL